MNNNKVSDEEENFITNAHRQTLHVHISEMIVGVCELSRIQSRDPSPRDSPTEQAITCVTLRIPRILLRYKVTWFMNMISNLISHSTKSVVLSPAVTGHIHILCTQYMT